MDIEQTLQHVCRQVGHPAPCPEACIGSAACSARHGPIPTSWHPAQPPRMWRRQPAAALSHRCLPVLFCDPCCATCTAYGMQTGAMPVTLRGPSQVGATLSRRLLCLSSSYNVQQHGLGRDAACQKGRL